MKRNTVLLLVVLLTCAISLGMLGNSARAEQYGNGVSEDVLVDWVDDFESYDLGPIHGFGGWKGWGNIPGAGADVVDTFSHSPDQSVAIISTSDLVHEYTGYNTGLWIYTAWQYIPSDYTGQTYFIMLNTYDDGGSTNNWSVQVFFDSVTNLVTNFGATPGTLPMIRGEWVELRTEIDLVNDLASFFYGGDLLYSATWTEENSGGGALNIGAVDLYGNSATVVYYDDISLVEVLPAEPDIDVLVTTPLDATLYPDEQTTIPFEICNVGDADLDWSLAENTAVPWLSEDPTSGTLIPLACVTVDVTFDSMGMLPGDYLSSLDITSNDPDEPLINLPVSLEVIEVLNFFVYLPVVFKDYAP